MASFPELPEAIANQIKIDAVTSEELGLVWVAYINENRHLKWVKLQKGVLPDEQGDVIDVYHWHLFDEDSFIIGIFSNLTSVVYDFPEIKTLGDLERVILFGTNIVPQNNVNAGINVQIPFEKISIQDFQNKGRLFYIQQYS